MAVTILDNDSDHVAIENLFSLSFSFSFCFVPIFLKISNFNWPGLGPASERRSAPTGGTAVGHGGAPALAN